MKVAVLAAPERIELVDRPKPSCGPAEVLVRMAGLGLCGTDLAVYHGSRTPPAWPWVMGHEGVGEIVAAGSEVTDRRAGQRVAIEPNYCCRRCAVCRAGFTSACPNRVAVGLNHPGLLAEFVAVPAEFCWPARDVAWEDLVCAEPLTVATAAIRRSGITAGSRCLVVGAGAQGLFCCLALLAMGAYPAVLEPDPARRALALTLGAADAEGATGEFDYLLEASGVPDALSAAARRLAPGGTATLIGMSPHPLTIPTSEVVYRQLTLRGSLIYDHPTDFADTIAALERGRLRPSRVLAGRFGFDSAADAFAAARTVPGKSWISLT
jgi:alcohol dehydrogenase/L-iditol 2-dehydrogenase